MKYLGMILAALWLSLAAPLAAENRLVVVELYTSQGCSSCPPADALLHKLAARDDVLPLALHVDYWDYIGWKDAFAHPAHAERQKGYAHAGGRTMIYTPQMVIMGQEDVVGAKGMELAELIARHHQARPLAAVTARRGEGGQARIRLEPLTGDLPGPFDVHLVRYDPLRHARITRGENAGRDLDYANVVAGWAVLGQWDGRAPAELTAPLDGQLPAAVLVQHPDHGAILVAARVE